MSNPQLTERQLTAVMHLANGLRYEEISTRMDISASSVEKIITSAKKKVGANSISHLVSIVIAGGLLYYEPGNQERSLSPQSQT
jgi:DNA-binding CsgD family transcriptional regulator